MKFGYFEDKNKEYVITSPKTPLPWINYLGCEDFFSLISNTGGGYSFYKDASFCASPDTATITFLWIPTDITTILTKTGRCGILAGCPLRQSLTAMSAATG